MEIHRVPRQLPPVNPRFDYRRAFCTATAAEPSIGDRMFILGTGFVGKAFAAQLKTKGWTVTASCTSVAKKKFLENLGYQTYIFDANDPQFEILEIVKKHTHLLVSVPPVAGIGDPLLRHRGLVKSILNTGHLEWLGYLSSTSVYGDCGGSLVDEDYPPKPLTELAKARLTAEEEWLKLGHDLGIASHVFRLGGIYGPGRSAVDTILKQKPLSKGQKMRRLKDYTSRVHVDDICQALDASILKPSSAKIYNIVDDDPAPRIEVFEFAQKLVAETFPGCTKSSSCSEREGSIIVERKRSVGEKRVSNARMKKELGVKLQHPTYRSGLRGIIEQMINH